MSGTGSDSSVIRYSANGIGQTGKQISLSNPAVFAATDFRLYIPGYAYGLVNDIGPQIVGAYSTGKFLPGTKIKWEPSVSFTTSGRVYVGFTDNPEVMTTLATASATFQATPTQANYDAYANQVKGMGSTRSFPIWQETEIAFPSRLRRKRFDANENVGTLVDVFDRSAQVCMFICMDGMGTTGGTYGSFWYHDVVDVEGVVPTAT